MQLVLIVGGLKKITLVKKYRNRELATQKICKEILNFFTDFKNLLLLTPNFNFF